MLKKMLTFSGLCLFVLAAAGVGRADTMTFNLTVDGCSGGCGSGPYGTITLTQNGSNVDVTETLATGYYFVNTGAGNPLAFNLNAAGTITNVASSTYFEAGGAATASTFGSFTDSIQCIPKVGKTPSPCGNGGSQSLSLPTSLTFTVDGVDISNFIKNTSGYFFAADVGEGGYSNDVWTIIATGNVGADGPGTPVIPEPPSLLLLGTGLAALAGMMKLRAAA